MLQGRHTKLILIKKVISKEINFYKINFMFSVPDPPHYVLFSDAKPQVFLKKAPQLGREGLFLKRRQRLVWK